LSSELRPGQPRLQRAFTHAKRALGSQVSGAQRVYVGLGDSENGFHDHANKDISSEKFFSNTDSAIAQELEGKIDRATRLWLGALHPLDREPD
jgi:hypothetical protein